MKEAPAIYLGQIVSKQHFRVFIYAPDGSQKLVESWDEYQRHMEGGLWFARKEDADASQPSVEEVEAEKPKASRQRRAPVKKVEEIKEDTATADEPVFDSQSNDLAFEVTAEDDFLPKTASK